MPEKLDYLEDGVFEDEGVAAFVPDGIDVRAEFSEPESNNVEYVEPATDLPEQRRNRQSILPWAVGGIAAMGAGLAAELIFKPRIFNPNRKPSRKHRARYA